MSEGSMPIGFEMGAKRDLGGLFKVGIFFGGIGLIGRACSVASFF